jgi:5-(carboxyamino)imidazole ribonucleotide synthase
MTAPILPGSKVGVLGSGQLGRMFAIAARRMGYRVHTFSPDSDTPTGQVADVEINASYDDLDAVRAFAKDVQVITFEFENVPSATAAAAAEHTLVRPAGEVLHITQNRLREKNFLAKAGFPVTPFGAVSSVEELTGVLAALGTPAVLKTAGFGYDGKGQAKIASIEDATKAFVGLGTTQAVVEGFVDFDCELSVIAARGVNGAFSYYGPVLNEHKNHILDVSVCPAPISSVVQAQAIEIAHQVVEALQVVGVLCVEFFLTKKGELLINELAPRPHNSGHYTFDACVTSQFEQQLRAVCGLPLGSTELLRPAAMVNLMGDIWQTRQPRWDRAAAIPEVKIHLYGKEEPRPGRKMGHMTALAATPEDARAKVLAARAAL